MKWTKVEDAASHHYKVEIDSEQDLKAILVTSLIRLHWLMAKGLEGHELILNPADCALLRRVIERQLDALARQAGVDG